MVVALANGSRSRAQPIVVGHLGPWALPSAFISSMACMPWPFPPPPPALCPVYDVYEGTKYESVPRIPSAACMAGRACRRMVRASAPDRAACIWARFQGQEQTIRSYRDDGQPTTDSDLSDKLTA